MAPHNQRNNPGNALQARDFILSIVVTLFRGLVLTTLYEWVRTLVDKQVHYIFGHNLVGNVLGVGLGQGVVGHGGAEASGEAQEIEEFEI